MKQLGFKDVVRDWPTVTRIEIGLERETEEEVVRFMGSAIVAVHEGEKDDRKEAGSKSQEDSGQE